MCVYVFLYRARTSLATSFLASRSVIPNKEFWSLLLPQRELNTSLSPLTRVRLRRLSSASEREVLCGRECS